MTCDFQQCDILTSVDSNEPVQPPLKLRNSRPLVKSGYQKINFLISQPKHMLWVLKRTVSMQQFF